MLYPIELLRHAIVASRSSATDGVHVNGQVPVCHVIRSHIKCRHAHWYVAGRFTVHFALPPKSHHCRLQPKQFHQVSYILVFKGLASG